jgi:sugar phosphate isomerase/epimerase
MIGIVGYTGFVGLNLQQFYKFDMFYNSKNFHEASNMHFDVLFFCGIPAVKWYANKNPDEDFVVIESIKSILNTITCGKIILISTIDVYELTNNDLINVILNEDYDCNYAVNHTYGKNRYLFEQYVCNNFQNHHIVRLPALFGKGLKKNILYDLIHNNQIQNIPINSSFQWYNLDRLKKDIDIIVKNDIKICNVFSESLETAKIVSLFDKIHGTKYSFEIEYFGNNNNNIVKYDVLTKYSELFDSTIHNYICDKDVVLHDIEQFLIYEKINKSKLCVSNICINQLSQIQFACMLKLFGIQNVQIAPTKLIEWDHLENIDLSVFKNLGINVYSFQSITYTLDHLNIFNDETRNELFIHLTKVIECAAKNNVKVLVFGCPKNRKVMEDTLTLNNNKIFIDFFKKVGDYCENMGFNVTICIENISKQYNCNYINKIDECASTVREINKPNIKMMIDLGNAVMENDTWYYANKYKDILYNIDISHPKMMDYSNLDESNKLFHIVLKDMNYDRMMNLEMAITDKDNELDILCKSLYNYISLFRV